MTLLKFSYPFYHKIGRNFNVQERRLKLFNGKCWPFCFVCAITNALVCNHRTETDSIFVDIYFYNALYGIQRKCGTRTNKTASLEIRLSTPWNIVLSKEDLMLVSEIILRASFIASELLIYMYITNDHVRTQSRSTVHYFLRFCGLQIVVSVSNMLLQ